MVQIRRMNWQDCDKEGLKVAGSNNQVSIQRNHNKIKIKKILILKVFNAVAKDNLLLGLKTCKSLWWWLVTAKIHCYYNFLIACKKLKCSFDFSQPWMEIVRTRNVQYIVNCKSHGGRVTSNMVSALVIVYVGLSCYIFIRPNLLLYRWRSLFKKKY